MSVRNIIQGIVNKIGDLSGNGITESSLAIAVKNDRTQLAANVSQNAKLLSSFGTVTGIADDYSTLMLAHANLSDGDVLLISTPVMIKTSVVWTKKIDIQCIGDKGYFILDVGSTNDGITVQGQGVNNANINSSNWKINIYGLANCCKNALVWDSVNLSTLNAKIKAGATQYGFVSEGCLLTTHNVIISVNYPSPLVGAVMPTNHILISHGVIGNSESNASKFNIKLEGGGNGITKLNSSELAGLEITGTIEGLQGAPFLLTKVSCLNLHDYYGGANALISTFTNCTVPSIISVINKALIFSFINCVGIKIDGYNGGLQFDATCTGTIKSWAITTPSSDIMNNTSNGISIEGVINNMVTPLSNGLLNAGNDTIENFFHNPFMDIWSLGASAVPDGWENSQNITWAKETTIVDSRNPMKTSAHVTSTATSINLGANTKIKSEYRTMATDRWVSICLALYIPSGQPNITVFLFNGLTFAAFGANITLKDQWVLLTGSVYTLANNGIDIVIRTRAVDGSYVGGEYYIGGLSISNSVIPTRKLLDMGKRTQHIVSSVSFAPAFIGQRALVSGKWYMAQNTTASTDWIILN